MLVIPVIDLRKGQAVRAIAGQRDQYRPLATSLSPSSDPDAVMLAYRSIYPFTTFYLADLDAIEHTGGNRSVVMQLLKAFPHAIFWLDAGFSTLQQVRSWPQNPRLRPVLGSESQSGPDAVAQLLQHCRDYRPLLSLDFKQGQFLGPAELLDRPDIWPQEVILMQLDRVGAGRGPDASLPAAEGKNFYAAGGVRDKADLQRLSAQGYAGVLVASALHDEQLSGADMAAFD
jgi:phosphoribosylformimino-5-aminoimidazole carboxamide ribotide isomerase